MLYVQGSMLLIIMKELKAESKKNDPTLFLDFWYSISLDLKHSNVVRTQYTNILFDFEI